MSKKIAKGKSSSLSNSKHKAIIKIKIKMIDFEFLLSQFMKAILRK